MRKTFFGFLISLLFFLLIEGLLWIISSLQGSDWRIDPLPKHPEYQVICEMGDMLKLCPDQGMDYERVWPEVFFKKKSGKRVITIGESFVFGLGLEEEESWPEQMRTFLGEDVEIINMARCGTYASRLVPILKSALELEPDVIVLATGNNEHTMTSFYTGAAGRNPLLTYRISKLFGGLQLYGVLYRVLLSSEPQVKESFTEAPTNLDDPEDQAAYAARRRPPDLTLFPDLLATKSVTDILEKEQRLKENIFAGHLSQMVELSKEARIPIILATLPRDMQAPPTLSGTHVSQEEKVLAIMKESRSAPMEKRGEIADKGLLVDNKISAFLYDKGMEAKASGNIEAAIQYVEAANSWDLIPDGTPEINQIIRQVAKEQSVPVVDLDIYARKHFARPSVIFLDKVHVNRQGAYEIAELVSKEITMLWEKE